MGRRSKQTVLQIIHTNGHKLTERCSISLIIREMQVKTTMRCHFTLARRAIIGKSTNAGEGVEKRESYYTVGGNVN